MNESGFDSGVFGLAFGAAFWLFIVATYFYFAFTQYKIAQKCGCQDNAWWAYIPIMNLVLLTQMAGKEWYWVVFCFVPFVNLIAFAVLWIKAAQNAGFSALWGFLALIPLVNFVSMGVMAFSGTTPSSSAPPPSTPSRQPEHVG